MNEVLLSFVGNRTSWVSKVIEWLPGARGPVCHVDCIADDGRYWGARLDRVGGQPSGFYPRPANYIAKETTHIIIALPCTPQQKVNFWEATWADEGEPYDWLGILGFVGGDWHTKAAGFCSEAQAKHLEIAGLFGPLPALPNTIAPMALLMMCAVYPGRRIIKNQGAIWRLPL